MAQFPAAFDSFTTVVDNVDNVLATHRNDVASAVLALETKVGIDSSADVNSLDYFARHASGRFRTHDHSGGLNGPPIPVANVSGAVNDSLTQQINGVKTFGSIPLLPDSNPTQNNEATRKLYVDGKAIKTLTFFLSGAVSVGTNLSARIKLNFAGTITKAIAFSKTAPVGSSMILDVNKNGTSIWNTNQANRLTIVSGANDATDRTTFDTSSFVAGDYFTVDVDAVGSTTPGSDITVQVEVSY